MEADGDEVTDLERMVALANLKRLDPVKGKDHSEEMWNIIRGLAVLDWKLRMTDPAERGEKAMEQYATLMRKVQQLAMAVMEEQGIAEKEMVVN